MSRGGRLRIGDIAILAVGSSLFHTTGTVLRHCRPLPGRIWKQQSDRSPAQITNCQIKGQ